MHIEFKKSVKNQVLAQVGIPELKKALEMIDEFKSRIQLMPYYVIYDKPQCQQNVYAFWVKTLNVVIRNYHEESCASREEIQKWFSFGCFAPIGLQSIINQMIQEGKIISANSKSDFDLQSIVRLQQRRSSVSKPTPDNQINKIWNKVLHMFTYNYSDGGRHNKIEQINLNEELIFVDYLISNVKVFEGILAHIYDANKDKIRVFSKGQLIQQNQKLNENCLCSKELEFILEIYLKYKLLHKVGDKVKDGLLQSIYVGLHDQILTCPQVQRDIGIFLIISYIFQKQIDELDNIENNMNQKLALMEKQDLQLKTAISKKKPEKERKLLFQQMKMIEQYTESLQQRRMVLFNHLHTLENAISDDQMLDTLESVNRVLQNFQIDQSQMKDALDSLNDTKLSQQGMLEDMQAFNSIDQDEIDKEFQKYQQEQEGDKFVFQTAPFVDIKTAPFVELKEVPFVELKTDTSPFNLDFDYFKPKQVIQQVDQQKKQKQQDKEFDELDQIQKQKQQDKQFEQELMDLL